ncbi:MAG: hypothetical protein IT572_04210 [Deltaproteobacteria bacterium]|nr:hypothetical protein [Deltaproteobacteria bacterium]
MRREHRGLSLLTGQTFTLETEGLLRPRNFRTHDVRQTLQEASAQRTVEHWLWLASGAVLLAAALF